VTRRVEVLGVRIDPVDRAALLRAVDGFVDDHARDGRTRVVAYANVHVLNTACRDERLRTFLNHADLCYCDGNGVVLGARWLGQHLPERMTGADWIWDLAAICEGRRKIFWLGGRPGVAAMAALKLRERFPRLRVDTEHGFHDHYGSVVRRVNESGAHVLLVGMGTPVQEHWLSRHLPALRVPVAWVTGATADFVSGAVSRGPAWLHQDYEWLARLVTEPRRLWKRYLLGNAAFALRVARERYSRSTSDL